jgi:hypothetical protein
VPRAAHSMPYKGEARRDGKQRETNRCEYGSNKKKPAGIVRRHHRERIVAARGCPAHQGVPRTPVSNMHRPCPPCQIWCDKFNPKRPKTKMGGYVVTVRVWESLGDSTGAVDRPGAGAAHSLTGCTTEHHLTQIQNGLYTRTPVFRAPRPRVRRRKNEVTLRRRISSGNRVFMVPTIPQGGLLLKQARGLGKTTDSLGR